MPACRWSRPTSSRTPLPPCDGPSTAALTQVTRHKDFADALAFVNAVGALAEAANHHPDIDIRWDTVTLRLLTHSRGGITDADLELAAEIDCLT